jgi:hypothetical protein
MEIASVGEEVWNQACASVLRDIHINAEQTWIQHLVAEGRWLGLTNRLALLELLDAPAETTAWQASISPSSWQGLKPATFQADLSVDKFISRTCLPELDSELSRKMRFMHFFGISFRLWEFLCIKTVDELTTDSPITLLQR